MTKRLLKWAGACWWLVHPGSPPCESSDRPGHVPSLTGVFACLGTRCLPMQMVRTLIRLGGCPDWFGSSVDARLVFSCSDSNVWRYFVIVKAFLSLIRWLRPTYPLQIIPFSSEKHARITRWDHVLSDMKWPDNYLHSENKDRTFLTITVIITSIVVRISEPLSTESIFFFFFFAHVYWPYMYISLGTI